MTYSPELQGLSQVEVSARLSLGQVNSQEFGSSRSLMTILSANLFTLFNGVVGGAFLVLLVLGYWQDALFGIAVLLNISVGIVQEYRSKRVLDKLTFLNQSPVTVRRAGESLQVRIHEVVLDDLVELNSGDQLPADCLILQSQTLEVDESALTGEAEPVTKSIGEELLAGATLTGGSALVQVIRVGSQTYSNKLTSQVRKFSKVSSEIRSSLDKLVLWISWALAPLILIVVYGQLQASSSWEAAVVSSVASVISMVPQGLVLISSIAFAIAAIKLAKHKVLPQELAAVEGLARVDVVCIDKTGTLTGNAMVFDQVVELPQSNSSSPNTNWRAVLGAFANAPRANATIKALQSEFPDQGLTVTNAVQFNSTTKFSSITVDGAIWCLGAPEMLTKDTQVLTQVRALATLGLRTILLVIEGKPNTAIAILTLKEDIRAEAAETLKYLLDEGVSVRVLSGDHPQTVAGVARSVGLEFEGPGFDARELPTDSGELAKLLETNSVFGRVTPEQKKLIVQALQQQGHVVGMIGDGVNDALALKQSDLGIAMGSGSAATRAVANLVLLDNRFAALPEVIVEGRRVIANVERLSRLFLTKTAWAMILAIVFGLTFLEFPFLPRQLSAVDAFTIGIPAFLIALLPNKARYQPGFLKRSLLFCIPAGALTAIAVISLAGIIRMDRTWVQSEAQSATAMLLSITGLWVLATLVRPLTAIKLGVLVLMTVFAVGMFTLPVTSDFFGLTYLTTPKLMFTFGVALVACIGIEAVNFTTRFRGRTTK
jgi:cation-transporting ATPase E